MNYEEFIFNLNRKLKNIDNDILYVCIGSSKIIWDSIGPRVGTLLKKEMSNVIGDMKNSFCSKKDYILNYKKIRKKYIVAIDAAFTNNNLKEDIFITNKPIKMGAGIKRNIGEIGDLGIKAIISKANRLNEYRINVISKFIADGIKSMKFL